MATIPTPSALSSNLILCKEQLQIPQLAGPAFTVGPPEGRQIGRLVGLCRTPYCAVQDMN